LKCTWFNMNLNLFKIGMGCQLQVEQPQAEDIIQVAI
jgi:hypothetical protein